MVQQAMQYIDETPDIETRIELIKTLNSVSAGKVSALCMNSPFCFIIFSHRIIHFKRHMFYQFVCCIVFFLDICWDWES